MKNYVNLHNAADAKNTFLFYTGSAGFVPATLYEFSDDGSVASSQTVDNRSDALRFCKHHTFNCTRLLQIDNWEFKDDYPWW